MAQRIILNFWKYFFMALTIYMAMLFYINSKNSGTECRSPKLNKFDFRLWVNLKSLFIKYCLLTACSLHSNLIIKQQDMPAKSMWILCELSWKISCVLDHQNCNLDEPHVCFTINVINIYMVLHCQQMLYFLCHREISHYFFTNITFIRPHVPLKAEFFH